ncbi:MULTISPECIES: UDP-N-acetylmuramoyl-tripeptide--D-alanyl-D-alanine ligase [Allobacillus]|uniref:UDP-N-acetylmuramoyl-tripeptide--D-alanyl-D-alanine ligase n=1 Tax=Allobacillus halotolerans TaxID=570278 RepID=A0ABS6GMZ7_9BACI|nr:MULTISPECIES: UDP-N-acetylmuramoyl-tripeptide--D-alanyl-D-alanine ligase [Allobacillus]MBU6080458.1 UDP-N-acetylmuramoyl-tripeptide--D-alanyl-D-alanine ligase [Allobacillus halotolerans]TSJ69311.1 UDP-N-acetylmuramoyl-tripeptide--D-alanyl-D-alanine ligase [Allobacillus sp. SKP2-8]
MEKFTLQFVAELFDHRLTEQQKNISIHHIYTDSRQSVENGLFIPIVGERFDAHDFISGAIERGAVAALWSRSEQPEGIPKNFPLIYVDDTLKALQELAKAYRQALDPTVIGVTGSNGKTTTKELIAACLSATYKTAKTEGNLNNHIGLPLTILRMERDVEVLVAEMGMSAFGEIELLSSIGQPDHAVITNIGESHIEFLGSREGIAKAKLEITAGLRKQGQLIIDGDEPLLTTNAYPNKIRCGFTAENDYRVEAYEQLQEASSVTINQTTFTLPLLGQHQALNAAFAIALAELMGVPTDQAINQLESVVMPGMRFEKIETKQGALVINDAYNASATSMVASIDVVKQMNYQRKVAVLADILELGDFTEQAHNKVGQSIDDQFDAIFTFGTSSRFILEGLPETFSGKQKHFTSKQALIEELTSELDENTVVLLKGSRSMKLEEIIEALQ